MKVRVLPKTQRARNRVSEHGKVMELVKRGQYQGQDACLLLSIRDTLCGEKWMGWLTTDEADVEDIELEEDPTPIYPWGNSPPRGHYVGD